MNRKYFNGGRMKNILKSEQFTATEWDSIQDKIKFTNHFVRFVQSDFKESLFYSWFYKRLSLTFGHIAHYNRQGFYETFFTTTKDKIEFLRMTLQYPCYGNPAFTYSDVEKVLQHWLNKEYILEKYIKQSGHEIENLERATLTRLKAKYE